jgi:hypothetical protein
MKAATNAGFSAADLLQKQQPAFIFSMKDCTLPGLLRRFFTSHGSPSLAEHPGMTALIGSLLYRRRRAVNRLGRRRFLLLFRVPCPTLSN